MKTREHAPVTAQAVKSGGVTFLTGVNIETNKDLPIEQQALVVVPNNQTNVSQNDQDNSLLEKQQAC